MSFSRFSTAGVYTFPTDPEWPGEVAAVGRHGTIYECCACPLLTDLESARLTSVDAFAEHLRAHRAAGHDAPEWIEASARAWPAQEVRHAVDLAAELGHVLAQPETVWDDDSVLCLCGTTVGAVPRDGDLLRGRPWPAQVAAVGLDHLRDAIEAERAAHLARRVAAMRGRG